MELTEILNLENLILIDTSIRADPLVIDESVNSDSLVMKSITSEPSITDNGVKSVPLDFGWWIYDINIYDHLDNQILEKEISSVEEFENILKCANTYTIDGVTREIRNFEIILNTKIKALSSSRFIRDNRKRRRVRGKSKKTRELLSDLQRKTYSMRRTSESKEIKLREWKGDLRYDLLLNMTKLIEREIELKKHSPYKISIYGKDKLKESDTDERLVAALYWLSLFSNKNPCLLTGDGDFGRLLRVITGLISSDSFLPYNKKFKESIMENPFKVYQKRGGKYGLIISSSKIEYDQEFKIFNINKERNLEVKQEISQTWEEFATQSLILTNKF